MSDYFGEMLQVAKNEFGSKVSDGVEAGDCLLYTSPSPRDS